MKTNQDQKANNEHMFGRVAHSGKGDTGRAIMGGAPRLAHTCHPGRSAQVGTNVPSWAERPGWHTRAILGEAPRMACLKKTLALHPKSTLVRHELQ